MSDKEILFNDGFAISCTCAICGGECEEHGMTFPICFECLGGIKDLLDVKQNIITEAVAGCYGDMKPPERVPRDGLAGRRARTSSGDGTVLGLTVNHEEYTEGPGHFPAVVVEFDDGTVTVEPVMKWDGKLNREVSNLTMLDRTKETS